MNKMMELVYALGSGPQAGAAASPESSGSTFFPIIMLGIVFVIMYFVVLRPQSKEQKKHREMIKALKKGDKVLTAGGIYGVVVGISDAENKVVIRIDENTKVEIAKAYVIGVKPEGQQEKAVEIK
jgi:preprotein translocase subunit YajC